MDKEKAKRSVKFITGKYENCVGKDTYIEGRVPKGKAVAVIAIDMVDIDGKDPELLASEVIDRHFK